KLLQELREKKKLAREKSSQIPTQSRRPSDFEEFLERKLARATAAIERHIREHGCQAEQISAGRS
ncbi:MAG: hypothetical protein ACRD2R_01825, partial [Terriglobales bacterium]